MEYPNRYQKSRETNNSGHSTINMEQYVVLIILDGMKFKRLEINLKKNLAYHF